MNTTTKGTDHQMSRCNFVRQAVPHVRCSNQESSVADRWQPDMRHHQAIGVGGAEWSTTRHIDNTGERPEVTWCLIVQEFVRQRGQIELNAFSNTYSQWRLMRASVIWSRKPRRYINRADALSSLPTEDGEVGRQEDLPALHCRNPAGSAPWRQSASRTKIQ